MDVREQQGDQSTTNKCFIVVLKQNHDIKLQKQNTGNQLFSDPVVYLRNDWAVFCQYFVKIRRAKKNWTSSYKGGGDTGSKTSQNRCVS